MRKHQLSWSYLRHRMIVAIYIPLSKGSNYISSLGYQTIQALMPSFTQLLFHFQEHVLMPLTNTIAHIPLLAPVLETLFKVLFLLGFALLLFCEDWLRLFLTLFIGKHPTGHRISVVNAMDPRFEFFDASIGPTQHLENQSMFEQRKQEAVNKETKPSLLKKMINRPEYSRSLAYTMSVLSKLGYEDLAIIKYELAQAGFDVIHTFQPFAYKNICAYVIEENDRIFLVFRGSNPLNIQNYLTNVDIRMRDVYAPWGYMGRVHKGYFDALGEPPFLFQEEKTNLPKKEIDRTERSLLEELLLHCKKATASTLEQIMKRWVNQLTDPVDGRFTTTSHTSMYTQAESYLLTLLTEQKQKKLYITGHSLGGALGTMFLAKMVQSSSPLLNHLGGLYTFGQPKIGDHQFSKIFDAKLSSKIFHHTYNNDIFSRLPSYSEYATPPGTLVFIDSAYAITIYPPDPYECTPVPVRPISHLHLSGLLNRHVLQRLPDENWIRILFRVLAPYMVNDHFAAEYPKCLQRGHVTWVIMGESIRGGSSSDDEDTDLDHGGDDKGKSTARKLMMTMMSQKKLRPVPRRRSSRINVSDEGE